VILRNDLKHESEAKDYWKKKALARSVKEEQLEWELQDRKETPSRKPSNQELFGPDTSDEESSA
jgi:hypothetical protein